LLSFGIRADAKSIQSHGDHGLIPAEAGDLDRRFVADETDESPKGRFIG
jgi:hypothetical protein